MSEASDAEKAKVWEVHLQMAQNALDFLASAARYFDTAFKNLTDLKFAVLHLNTALELLMKSRLVLIDWELIVTENGSPGDFAQGKLHTINFCECQKRLKKHLRRSERAQDKRIVYLLKQYKGRLDKFRKWRNRLEHFAPPHPVEEYEPWLTEVFSFAVEVATPIIDEVFGEAPGAGVDLCDRLTDVIVSLGELKHTELVEQRCRDIKPELDNARSTGKAIIICPRCKHRTLYLAEDFPSCLYCREKFARHYHFERWFEHATGDDLAGKDLEGHEMSAGICPNCEDVGLYVRLDERMAEYEEYATVCFSCGYATPSKAADR